MEDPIHELASWRQRLRQYAAEFEAAPEVTTLREAYERANELRKSASGSTLGYHANVYYRDFKEPPPGETFDVEWGIGGGMFAPANPNWVEYSPSEVLAHLYGSDGDAALESARTKQGAGLKLWQQAKEAALSILTLHLQSRDDPFLKRLAEEIEKLKVLDANEIVQQMVHRGPVMTRDSKAMSQGGWTPPHVRVRAQIDAVHQPAAHAKELADTFEKLESHLGRAERLHKEGRGAMPSMSPQTQAVDNVSVVENVLRNFHHAVRPLKERHDARTPFAISDEYDVQDVLHAFLRTLFADIRPEEFSPSYAGGGSRMDFLLKGEDIVVEAKMANAKLRDKLVGDQLVIDIQKYRSHPNCKHLICFVYDPNGFIKNPHGLESDLTRPHDGLDVRVIVSSH